MQSKILGIKPLISVIVPVYNAEKYLSKCLDSILAQTYTNLEIILVDDGSTDNSSKICEKYARKDNRIKVIHKQNGGVSSARNTALAIVTGEYIGFVDSDDYVDHDMYDYLLSLIILNKADISRCSIYEISPIISNTKSLPPQKALEVCYPHLYVCNMLFSKACIANIAFDEDIAFGEDMKFCVEALSNSKKAVCGCEPKYHYYTNPKSATKKSFNIKKLTYFKAAEYVLNFARKNNLITLTRKIKEQICYHAVGFLRQIADSGYQDKRIIANLQIKVRKGIFQHLLSKHKISNKLFSLVCCINFNLAAWLYKKLNKRDLVQK